MVKSDHGCDPLAGQKRMEQTSEGIPFAEPKSELASEELMRNGSYGADLCRDASLFSCRSELTQQQLVVFLKHVDVNLFGNAPIHTDRQQRPIVPLEKPDVKVLKNTAGSTLFEPKYVTSYLLSDIKVEKTEDDDILPTDHPHEDAVLHLVKPEIEIEYAHGISANEELELKPDIKVINELVPMEIKGDLDNAQQEMRTQSSNVLNNPVVLLERLDPELVRSHLRALEPAANSSRVVASSQLKPEENSNVRQDCDCNQDRGNHGISQPVLDIPKTPKDQQQSRSNSRTLNKSAATNEEKATSSNLSVCISSWR
ncbi:uncharacterized protein [Bemisia tabaci]|uniref:uncharacterized protein n=1 Tax=Bemisia tabaci TaxID=7038 RepID=UPI003B283CF7